ncbi:MAG: hypothetical protein KAG19_06960 [Methylococcales bacterium]|nr:hypothetical protein [Methylococcales bacterium]
MKNMLIAALLLMFSSIATAEIVVIGSLDNELNSLTKRQVIAIFMGRTRSFSNGVRALPLDEESLRNEFYETLTHRSIKQIDAYWARLTFSGQTSSPPMRQSQQHIIDEVKISKGKIAYIRKEDLADDSQVKILFSVK